MEYLEKVLGINVAYEEAMVRHLPNFINTRYRLQIVSLNGKKVIFAYPKTELEQIETLKKHIVRIPQSEDLPVVLIPEQITSRQKEYLIREKIPFVVEDKQIYLPFMAVYLQERCSAEKFLREELLPSAQMLFLHFIYNGAKELTTSQAAKHLNLTPTSISRASKQLVELGLLQTKKVGVQKILFAEGTPREVFQNAEKQLVNPVKRTVYVSKESIGAELLRSGYSALAEYSMLNAPSVECYAAEKISHWNEITTNSLQDSKTQVAVEMWRYDPRKLSNEKAVDKLSLALALRDDADERVEEAVEKMLDDLWRKIDGYWN